MNTPVTSHTPAEQPTKLEQLRADLNRLRLESDATDAQLSAANSRTLQLDRSIEEAEDAVVHGRIDPATLKDLQAQHVAAQIHAAQLSSERRMTHRLVDKTQGAVATEVDRAKSELRQKTKRQICELLAPLLDAAVTALNGILKLDISSDLDRWSQPSDNLGESTRFCRISLSVAMRRILSGDRGVLVDAIGDLRAAAPDLVTAGMEAFLDDSRVLADSRVGSRSAQPDSKALAAIEFSWRQLEQAAVRSLFAKPRVAEGRV